MSTGNCLIWQWISISPKPRVGYTEPIRSSKFWMDAEVEGFEPPVHLRAQRFSRPPHSTALAHLRKKEELVKPF